MGNADIFMRSGPKEPWTLWGARHGTMAEIRRSAESLLVSMVIDEGLRAPATRIGKNGRAITRRQVAAQIEEARA